MKKNEEIKLGAALDRIMKAKSWDQTQLGKKVGASQPMISRMRKGDDWEQHWQVFMKLLPLLVEVNIIDPNRLKCMSDNGDNQKVENREPNKSESQDNLTENAHLIDGIMLTKFFTSLVLQ